MSKMMAKWYCIFRARGVKGATYQNFNKLHDSNFSFAGLCRDVNTQLAMPYELRRCTKRAERKIEYGILEKDKMIKPLEDEVDNMQMELKLKKISAQYVNIKRLLQSRLRVRRKRVLIWSNNKLQASRGCSYSWEEGRVVEKSCYQSDQL